MKNYLFLILAVLFWSGNFIFGRFVSSSIDATELSFFRWFLVLVILSPYIILRYKNIFKIFKTKYLILITLGALGISGFNTFLYYGLQTTTATNALLINSSTPIFIIIFSSVIFKITVTKVQTVGILLSTIGMIYIVLKGNILFLSSLEFSSGDLWIVLASFTWALYCVLLKFKPKELNPLEFFCSTTIIGVVFLFILYIYQGYSFSDLKFISNNNVLFSLLYMVIFPSILSFYFWNMSTIEVGANKAGQFTHLMPIFGAVIAYFFLGELLEVYHLVGILLIFTGIYLSSFFKKRVKV